MKRCLLVAAFLLGVHCCIGLASADYVVIKIDLNQILHPPQAAPAPGPGVIPPNPSTVPPPTYYPPAKGAPGKGGKGVGGKGVGGIPKQPVQPQPNPPVQPQPYPPTQPGGAGQPGTAQPAPVSTEPPMYVYAYLELKSAQQPIPIIKGSPIQSKMVTFDYKFGDQKMKLWVRDQDLFNVPAAPISKEFTAKYDKAQKELKASPDDGKKEELVIVAKWALRRGMLPEFEKCINLLKTYDAKHPVVVAVDRTRELLNQPPKTDDPAAQTLMQELGSQGYQKYVRKPPVAKKNEQKKEPKIKIDHYTLLTNMSMTDNDEALEKKLDRLEDVYTTFFYWFAVNEQPRTPPPYRLVVAVVDTPLKNPGDFIAKHKAFGSLPMVGSGFTAQRDNVIIMASRRTDPIYEELQRYNEAQWVINETNMDDLLTKVTDLQLSKFNPNTRQKLGTNLKDLPVLQALALCQKAMDEENDVVTLSHEGMRQLIAATGLLPRNMMTAEWTRFGLASFFEVPPEAIYPTMAGPNWAHLTNFKLMIREKKLDVKDARELFLKTIADDYLQHAYSAVKQALAAKEDRAGWTAQAEHELEWARATAWSVMYYLAGERDKDLQRSVRHKNLQRYFDEINSLPRDSAFDARVLVHAFCKAFDLIKADPANPARQIVDDAKLDKMAEDWFTTMEKLRLPVPEYEKFVDVLKHPGATQQPPAVTTQPGYGQPGQPPYPGVQPQPGIPQPGVPPKLPAKKGKG
ncbi:MAG TPA: DUF1570 domain-containing protein [Gemmataceae bacterium]|nr:DUF1570 domain-containing protein [Gemmataceae bacterium]